MLRALLASGRASQSRICAKAGLGQSSWPTKDCRTSEGVWILFWGQEAAEGSACGSFRRDMLGLWQAESRVQGWKDPAGFAGRWRVHACVCVCARYTTGQASWGGLSLLSSRGLSNLCLLLSLATLSSSLSTSLGPKPQVTQRSWNRQFPIPGHRRSWGQWF